MRDRPVFVIGAARAGSTALAEYIASGLGLSLARGKESHFLASRGIPERSGGPSGRDFDSARDKSIKDFRTRFPVNASTGILDASTSSLYYSQSTSQMLDEHFPDALLIAVLRHPAHRAISAYRYMRARGYEKLSWSDALESEERRIHAGWPHIWHYSRESSYSSQLQGLGRWCERTLFLLYERDLADDALLDRISAHTGYPVVNRKPLERRNQAQAFSSPLVGRAAESLRASWLGRVAPPGARAAGTRVVNHLRSTKAPDYGSVDETLVAHLVGREAGSVSEITGLDCVAVWNR
jgi:hypothetical protein